MTDIKSILNIHEDVPVRVTSPDDVLRKLSIYTPRTTDFVKDSTAYTNIALKNIAREALTHIECYKRLGSLITQPLRLGWRNDKTISFSSQRVNGMTAYDYMIRHPESTADIVIKVMDAIESLHSQGIAHRDLHSSNIMVCEDDNIKIIDFGYSIIRDHAIDGAEYGPMWAATFHKSADACIFMRSVALSMRNNPYHPFLDTYDIIMRAYERECQDLLPYKDKPDCWQQVPSFISDKSHREALLDLYNIENDWRQCRELDYYLTHFDWKTMHPENIKDTIRKNYVYM